MLSACACGSDGWSSHLCSIAAAWIATAWANSNNSVVASTPEPSPAILQVSTSLLDSIVRGATTSCAREQSPHSTTCSFQRTRGLTLRTTHALLRGHSPTSTPESLPSITHPRARFPYLHDDLRACYSRHDRGCVGNGERADCGCYVVFPPSSTVPNDGCSVELQRVAAEHPVELV